MSEPIEPPNPDYDDLTRDELEEINPMAARVADVLDDWIGRRFGILSGGHGAGLFLDLLAAEGYRVEPIVVPAFEDVLPVEGGDPK